MALKVFWLKGGTKDGIRTGAATEREKILVFIIRILILITNLSVNMQKKKILGSLATMKQEPRSRTTSVSLIAHSPTVRGMV